MEQQHVPRMNIVIATPGRLLQHLEQTAGLDVDRVCVLVLDEADRILDLGFRDQMVRILDYLPPGNNGEEEDDMPQLCRESTQPNSKYSANFANN